MSEDLVIVPSNGDGYTELARTKSGRLFRKHILSKGELIHPKTKKKIKIDDTFVNTLKNNFANGVCDIVQVPLANKDNEHTEAPERNIGEVIGIEEKDNKVYALIDARKPKYADELGKTLLGASAFLHLDYTDTKTDTKVGPTLLHACVTNRPYVTGLENYEEILSATSDTSSGAVVLTTELVEVQATEETTDMPEEATTTTAPPAKPTRDELLASLKADHGIDVSALQATAEETASAAQLSKTLLDALTQAGVVKLTADTTSVSTDDVVGAVAELAQNNVTLTNKVTTLERKDAETTVDALIADGRVMPKQRHGFIELKLTNEAMFAELVPAEPIVKLNHERGADEPDAGAHTLDIDQEITRLSALISGGK